MQTTQNMMKFRSAKIEPVNMGVYYINIYKDKHGETRYSSSELKIGQDGLFSFDDALQEACRLCVLGDWTYIGTATTDAPKAITARMQRHLENLERDVALLKTSGKDPSGYSWEEITTLADEIRGK